MSTIRPAGETPTTNEPYTDDEVAQFYENYPLASGVEIPEMQAAQPPSSNDSCMGDFLSILKVVLPAVAPLM
jgi:hypothetical protein